MNRNPFYLHKTNTDDNYSSTKVALIKKIQYTYSYCVVNQWGMIN